MMLQGDKIATVLNKVRAVRDHMQKNWQADQGFILPVEDLHWAVQDYCDLTVEIIEVLFIAEHLSGTVERYGNKKARILIRSGQSDAFMRFATVKELSHLVIDDKDHWSSHGVETVDHLMTEWKLVSNGGVGHDKPEPPLQSEYLAEIAATEFLYPFMYRQADIEKIAAKSSSVSKITLEHEAPAHAIEQALRHHDILKIIWDKIDQAG